MPDNSQDADPIGLRVEEEIAAFRTAYQQVEIALQGLEATLTPSQAVACAHLRDAVLTSYRDTRLMAALLEEVTEYNKMLVAQRQSSREMFISGGNAMLADLMAMATGPEFAQLRHLIERLVKQDALPF